MDNSIMFKTSAFGGFDKKAVISYIFDLNEKAKADQERLTAQLEEANIAREGQEQKLHELDNKIQKLQGDLETTRTNLETEKARSVEMSNMLDKLKEDVARQEQIVREKDGEIRKLTNLNSTLEQRNQLLERKSKEVEQATAQVGRLLLEANSDAARIVEEARVDAEKVVEHAKTEAEHAAMAAQKEANLILENASMSARETVENANDSIVQTRNQLGCFREDMRDAQQTILEAMTMLQERLQLVNEVLNQAEDSLGDCNVAEVLSFTVGGVPERPREKLEDDEDFFRVAAEN